MINKITEILKTITEKLNSLFKEKKLPDDWSLTSFLSAFSVIVPITLWVILSVFAGVLLAIPESVVVIILVGITGKVYGLKKKLENENNGK